MQIGQVVSRCQPAGGEGGPVQGIPLISVLVRLQGVGPRSFAPGGNFRGLLREVLQLGGAVKYLQPFLAAQFLRGSEGLRGLVALLENPEIPTLPEIVESYDEAYDHGKFLQLIPKNQ
jgi:hypothetical protein